MGSQPAGNAPLNLGSLSAPRPAVSGVVDSLAWNPGGFFTDPSFATYQPEQATAPARTVLTTFIPGVGFAAPGVPGAGLIPGSGLASIPLAGLVGVLVIVYLFEHLRIRRRR